MPSDQVATVLRFNDAFNRRDVEEILRELDSGVELTEWPDAPGSGLEGAKTSGEEKA